MPRRRTTKSPSGIEHDVPTAAEHFQKMLIGSLGITAEMDAIRNKYVDRPVDWVKDRLGEHLWSKQREVIESVRDHRLTAVRSAHSTGKSWLAARIAAWWIETHEPGTAFVVTTATTADQVGGVVWRELRDLHARAGLSGRTTMHNNWYINARAGNEILVAKGVKPADSNPTALQGLHCRYLLLIIDEAAGFADPLWNAADSLASGAENRILAVGNPDFPTGEFVNCFHPKSKWNPIHISALDTPNFTGEEVPDELHHVLVSKAWQEEKLLKWGLDNPLYQSKVLGEFPIVNEHGLIPIRWIHEAQQRWEAFKNGNPLEPQDNESVLGVDVGGGTDRSVIAHRVGPRVYIKPQWRTSNPNTMETLGLVMSVLKETEADLCLVDAIGIGQGIVDRAYDIATDQDGRKKDAARKARAGKIRGVKVGTEAKDSDSYVNLRAEAYWNLRERFQDGRIALDPNDEDLAGELADIQFKRTSRGQIQIESKIDMKRRGKPSPDNADAVMLAYCDPNVKKRLTKATWGRRKPLPGSVATRPLRPISPGRSGRR